jgi:hypothetical protein
VWEEYVRESLVRSWAWILVVLFPASMVTADVSSAMLNASGNVSVNGAPIQRAMAIFPGDKVQTGPNALATLTNAGSSVTVPSNSSVIFSRSAVNVLCGSALVSTSRGLAVRVANLLVQPPRGVPARFQVMQDETQLQIIAREGTLAIDNGAATSSLQPGRVLTASANCMAATPYMEADASSSPMPQNQSQDQNNNKKRGAAARTTPPPTGGINTGAVFLYAAAAGGVAAFLVWLTTRSPASCNTTNCINTP